MSDNEVAEKMAQLFISLGGDVDGFAYMYTTIRDKIKKQLSLEEK